MDTGGRRGLSPQSPPSIVSSENGMSGLITTSFQISFRLCFFFRNLVAFGDLDYTSCYIFYVLKEVPIYLSFSGKYCDDVVLWSSRNVLWTTVFPMAWIFFFSFLFLVHFCFKIVKVCSKNQNNTHRTLWSPARSLIARHPHRCYIKMVRSSCISWCL